MVGEFGLDEVAEDGDLGFAVRFLAWLCRGRA